MTVASRPSFQRASHILSFGPIARDRLWLILHDQYLQKLSRRSKRTRISGWQLGNLLPATLRRDDEATKHRGARHYPAPTLQVYLLLGCHNAGRYTDAERDCQENYLRNPRL